MTFSLRPRVRQWLMRQIPLLSYTVAAYLLVAAVPAKAQNIEPRAFSNAPVGVNFLITGYAYTRGGLATDPSLPISNPRIQTSGGVLAYARALDFFGNSAKIDASLPYNGLSGSATFNGQPIERTVNGVGDARVRMAVNFYGAPALRMPDFKDYKQDLIIGTALQLTLPVGQYDPTRVVNLGTNRWSLTPELGISKALGPLTLELTPAVTFYTDNTNFLDGHRRSQAPIYAVQGHAIYSFGGGFWGSLDATYFTGGSTEIDNHPNQDLQRNWRVGVTLAMPITTRYSVKFFASAGVSARTGNNYDLIGAFLQYRWGGGL
ncbi:MAG TPA: transporter [Rhodopila sp.]|nr:transporter [Rhodopila sp.]